MTPEPTFAQQLFASAVEQLRGQRDARLLARTTDTPICRDMRQTARELGIVDLLLEHQRIVSTEPSRGYDLVEQALILLGVSADDHSPL